MDYMVKECQHKINNEIYIQKSKRGNSLEDAKMRMGKVIQAVDGVSIYDTPATKN